MARGVGGKQECAGSLKPSRVGVLRSKWPSRPEREVPPPHFTWEDTETLGSQCHIAKSDSNPIGSDVRTPRRGLGQEGGRQMLPLSFPKPRTTGPSSLASSDLSSRLVTLTTTHSQSGPSLRRPLWEHRPQPAPREPSTKGGRWHWGEVTETPSHGSPTPHGCH